MPDKVRSGLSAINHALLLLLEETRRSLAGQGDFNLELVRKLSSLVSAADPLVRRGRELRAEHPELSAPIDHYLHMAGELQAELDRVNVMLVARREFLEAARSQLHAASQFVDALSSTR